jgi:uncharacterized protein
MHVNRCCGQVLGHTRWCQGVKAVEGDRPTEPFPNEEAGWMQTFSGRKFYPLKPIADDICIEDIAHHLSMLCRYNGATKMFYSVAQHCVLASKLFGHGQRAERLAALLHDASEAYFGDFIRPLKYQPEFAFVLEADEQLQSMINVKFGLAPDAHKAVKVADIEIFLREAHCEVLMAPRNPEWILPEPQAKFRGFSPWSPCTAEAAFMREFRSIFYGGSVYATDFMPGGAGTEGA